MAMVANNVAGLESVTEKKTFKKLPPRPKTVSKTDTCMINSGMKNGFGISKFIMIDIKI